MAMNRAPLALLENGRSTDSVVHLSEQRGREKRSTSLYAELHRTATEAHRLAKTWVIDEGAVIFCG
jgi:hypothetical protein